MTKRTPDRKILIAIVDDEADFRTILSRWLEPQYDTADFANADDLLARPGKKAPDLIITDLRMPGLDGIGLCKTLRDHPRYGRTPVLILTGVSAAKGLLAGQETGASAYLTKPIERRELLEQVEKLLDAQAF
jgi:CheY-like chemotaxis protein